MRTAAAIVACGFLTSGAAASAQTPPAPQGGTTRQTMTVERVYSPWVVGPEYKVTRIDGGTGQLAGVAGGRLIEELFYVGGAMYWLAGGASAWDLHYGGLVLGFQMPSGERVAFGVRGLVGAGGATNSLTLQELFGDRGRLPDGRLIRFGHRGTFVPDGTRVELSDVFLVFEPEATISWKVTNRIRFGASAGYRFTGHPEAYAFDDRLNGATGAVTIQFGLGGS